MRRAQWAALAALIGTVGLAMPALSQKAQDKQQKGPQTVPARIVAATKLPEADVQKMLAALGPAIRDQLRTGAVVEVPGLGVFRVVRIPDHKDLVAGRPATVPGYNYVEFLPAEDVGAAANAAGAVPQETVPPFEYLVNPNSAPSMRVGTTRQGGTRTR
jgi:nucleoid DNA-binding protein